MQNSFSRLNSKRLKKYFTPFNPILGYPLDPDRFLFNVNGLRKSYLPSSMKNVPLIQELIKHKSLSSFIRSIYFKNNFNSVSQLILKLDAIRLRFDFPYWIAKTYDPHFSFNGFRSLVMNLQKLRSSFSSLKVIIRKNDHQDISCLIFLFIIWCKSFGLSHTNVMTVTPSNAVSKKLRTFLLDWKDSTGSNEGVFFKTDFANSISHPSSESKFWFVPYHSPGNCRGRDYTILHFSDMGKWVNTDKALKDNVIRASFPVINCSRDNMIILEAGPFKRNSLFEREFIHAEKNQTPFSIIRIPWSDDHENFYRFDFKEDAVKFYNNLILYRNRRTFPHFPMVSGKKLYHLWLHGLPLEAIHWYASEASFFKTHSRFLNHFPELNICPSFPKNSSSG